MNLGLGGGNEGIIPVKNKAHPLGLFILISPFLVD